MSTRYLALGVLIVLALCIVVSVLSPSTPPQPSTPAPSRRPTATPTIEARILAAIGEIDRPGAESPVVKITDQLVLVVFPMDDSLTANWGRRFTLDTVLDVARTVREHTANTRELRIGVSGPITDAYGNTSEEHVFSVYLKPATLKKINFDAFDIDNLPVVADYYWQHPAFDR